MMKQLKKRSFIFVIAVSVLLGGGLWACNRYSNRDIEESGILSDSDKNMLRRFFSMAPRDAYDGEYDFYFSIVTQSLMMWQREGIDSWLVDDDGTPIIGDNPPLILLERLERAKRWSETANERRDLYVHMNLLLHGNFTIKGIEEMGGVGPQLVNEGAVELTVVEFVRAFNEIDKIAEVSIEHEWNAHLWRLLREEE